MHNYTARQMEIAEVVRRETGLTIDEDFQPVILQNSEISVLAGTQAFEDYWYFGDIVITGYDQFLSEMQLTNTLSVLGDTNTMLVSSTGGSVARSNIYKEVLWNQVATWSDVSGYFYGYKVNRAHGWVEQVASLTPGAGWTNAGTIYTHVSGTTEQIYLGAWTLSSTLRVTITFTGITTGSTTLQMDNSGTFATITANGAYTFEVTTNGSDGALFIVPSNTFNGTYDNATFKVEKLTYI